MNLSEYGANTLMDGGTMPATLWVQLHIGDPTAAGTANVAIDDRRVSFTRTDASAGVAVNEALLEWLLAPADEDLTHISVWDDDDAGNCWWVGAITGAPVQTVTGQATEIALNLLSLALTIWS